LGKSAGLWGWFTTIVHKEIGNRYLVTTVLFLITALGVGDLKGSVTAVIPVDWRVTDTYFVAFALPLRTGRSERRPRVRGKVRNMSQKLSFVAKNIIPP